MSQNSMDNCIVYIIKGIINEMTPAQKMILSVGYPMETEAEQIESIKNKAKFVVLNYSIDQNTPKEQGESLKKLIGTQEGYSDAIDETITKLSEPAIIRLIFLLIFMFFHP